jgi:hypothetical protein
VSSLDLDTLVSEAHASNNYDALLQMVPYARLIGIECLRLGDDMVFRLPKTRTTSEIPRFRLSMEG